MPIAMDQDNLGNSNPTPTPEQPPTPAPEQPPAPPLEPPPAPAPEPPPAPAPEPPPAPAPEPPPAPAPEPPLSSLVIAPGQKTVTIAKQVYNVLPSDVAFDMLKQGKPIEEVYIESLQFSTAAQPTTYSSRIIIKKSIIGQLQFGPSCFEQPIQIEDCRIVKEVIITEATQFNNVLLCNGCVFEKSFAIRGTQLLHGFSAVNSHFQGGFALERSEFGEEVNLSRATFDKRFSLQDCEFSKTLRLKDVIWKGDTLFTLCNFEENVCGDNAQILGSTLIKDSKFHGTVYFEGCFTKARIDLEKLECDEMMRWNGTTFEDKFVIRACIFHKNLSICNVICKDHLSLPQSRIEGEMALDGSVLEERVFFTECFIEDASWRGVTFKQSVDAEKMRIGAELLCQGTTFHQHTSFAFMESEGRGRLSFNAIFKAKVDFYRATLRGPVWFLGSHFHDVCFVNTAFEGQVFFSYDFSTLRERNRRRQKTVKEQSLTFVARFQGEVNFTNTLFYRKAVFENVFFENFANFENAYFAEEINFQNSHFKKGATFKGIFCTQEMDFTKAVFDEYVNFDLANINRRLNLTDAAIDQGISFYHAVIDVVVVEREQIQGRLVYEGKVKNREFQKHFMRVKEEYLILKESFHQRGKFDEEDWAYHSYRVNDRKSMTDKALRSLRGIPILAIQDDVPEDEREDDQLLIDAAKKTLEKSAKSLESYRNRVQKLKERAQDPSKAEKADAQLVDVEAKLKEQEQTVALNQEELTDVEEVVRMNAERKSKLHESRDKPFTKFQALRYLAKNALWKLVDWGTGYGVKPFRITLLAVAVIFAFAAAYFFSGVTLPNYSPESHTTLGQFFDWLYFSAMTFATACPAQDTLAFNDKIEFLIMSESLIGLFLSALFVGCYTRKIIR